MKPIASVLLLLLLVCPSAAQKRLVIVDQDGSGPGGSNQLSMLALLQSPQAQVLGITMVTGNSWCDEEVQHTLRMLELTGHSDVPVVPGAVFPLVRTQDETMIGRQLNGTPSWLGAWGGVPVSDVQNVPAGTVIPAAPVHGPWEVPPLEEGAPHIRPLAEDAAHFLVRQVRAHPGQVTIVAMGPLTNIALAIAIEPKFAEMTRGIAIMGGSLNPQTSDPAMTAEPRYEFNLWFDPEAAHIVLRAHWPRIDVTTVDISVQTMFTQAMADQIARSTSPAAQYIAKFSKERYYQWDELAACAWLDPSLIRKTQDVYLDVDLSHGPSYGNTLSWPAALKPATDVQRVHAQMEVDLPRFDAMFVELMSR